MKKLLFGCALAVPALAGLMNLAYVPEAEALPAQSCELEYYSDATYSTPVGGSTLLCTGKRVTWGITTPYSQIVSCESC